MADNSNPFLDMFQNFGEQMKIPGADLNQMMDIHRKNLQALQEATQIGTSSAQAVMKKQRAMLEQSLADIAATVQDVAKATDPSAAMSTPLELAKKSFDMTVANATEIGEIVKQGNMDAFNVLKDRVMESMEEVMSPGQEAPKPAAKKRK